MSSKHGFHTPEAPNRRRCFSWKSHRMEGEIPGPIQLRGFAGRPNWGGLDGLLYPVLCIVRTSMRARFVTGTGVRELGLWLSPLGEKMGFSALQLATTMPHSSLLPELLDHIADDLFGGSPRCLVPSPPSIWIFNKYRITLKERKEESRSRGRTEDRRMVFLIAVLCSPTRWECARIGEGHFHRSPRR